ncbi:2-amino-4-hydroxy-6-hydroxymethyldihydropteridine diphosphokinase [Gordonia shandongensis]|uniref:2-amino-4-hydroxy-6- hydroxymethyldihydropteridine diphosphokinase n=1 Tax=Gordonia shandongensis TaxID=376351 RepID=UPI0004156C15|nr:2-amino-4-hydroxy-6-hydroxymethyldihydropteridine diphosphokinase [Gordonia shandongensis]
MTTRAVLSAGSNIGDSRARLREVAEALADDLVAVSGVYRTAPWGGVRQDDFLNVTLIAEGERRPIDWLDFCRRAEQAADRVRDVRWGPRTLDVDVIDIAADFQTADFQTADFQTVVSDDEELTLPHPRAAQRAFVLVPWLEIDADARLWTPSGPAAVTDLVAALDPDETAGVVRVGDLA